jgi:outer membrane lipoprotein-sorting protein
MSTQPGTRLWMSISWKLCSQVLFFVFWGLLSAMAQTQAQKDSQLRQAFIKIDEAAKGFRTFSARFTQRNYTAIIDDFDPPQAGVYFYSFDKDRTALWRYETMNPMRKILTVRKGMATMYQPSVKEATIYNLGKRRQYIDYLAAGIGRSAAELQEKFNISLQGIGSIAGAPCFVLRCKPRDKAVSSQVTSITIWVKKSSGTPAQFKIEAPSDDYMLLTFSDEKLNAEIPISAFEQNLPAGVSITRIQ